MPKVPAPLTDTAIKALKPNSKKCDGGNLYIVVKSDGTKWWKYDYIRPDGSGKRNSISFGIYPIVSLKKARDKREATKILIKDGIDPSEDKKQNKIKEAVEAKNSSLTFQKVLGEYFEIIKVGLSIKHFEKIQRRFELDVLPLIGNKIMGDILHSELLSCIKRIEDRGAIETARRILNHCERIWKYAISTGQANYNITSNIDKATTLKKIPKKNFPHITNLNELKFLLLAIDNYNGDFSTRWALKLLPLIFVRPYNIRFMEWSEIDFDKKLWIIPAEKMKMKLSHIVPLSDQAIGILYEVQKINGLYRYVFTSPITTLKPISENTLNQGLQRIGYKDKMVSHGFRHTASTLLHENIDNHGFHSLVIEAQLAHVEQNTVKAVYNKAEYINQRIKMMQWWADYLEELKKS